MFVLVEELVGLLIATAAMWTCVFCIHTVLHWLRNSCRPKRKLQASPQYNQRTNPAPGWKSDRYGRRISSR